MSSISLENCKNMVRGALVADAAAMGLHWIYDQQRIRAVAPDAPEFTAPNREHYDGVPAYFAHSQRPAGALSQYGEQAMVMLRTLASSGGKFDRLEFASQFREHFGYGGVYVGYIDHATRDTLDNMRRFEDAAYACAEQMPFAGEGKVAKSLVAKALPMLPRFSGGALEKAFQDSVASGDETTRAYAAQLIVALEEIPLPLGAHDLQLPATAKLPALVALQVSNGITTGPSFKDDVSSAVRVTNDHPVAVEYAFISAQLMMGALTRGTVADAVEAALEVAGPEAKALLEQAVSMKDLSNQAATQHFGMACDLPNGVPSAVHNILTAPSFAEAVRCNIYSGGDSCGRAIPVGAVMGAIHGRNGKQGIPQDWIDRLERKAEMEQLLSKLFGET